MKKQTTKNETMPAQNYKARVETAYALFLAGWAVLIIGHI